MAFDDLTDEQRERARACTTAEELTSFLRDEGIELSDEALDGIAAGKRQFGTPDCPTYLTPQQEEEIIRIFEMAPVGY